MPEYDYLIVGAGMFGATFASEMTDAGKTCLVIDKRSHIAGNCYTETVESIQVHRFGPHIFHTDNRSIWEYAHRFTEFNNFTYRPRACFKGRLFSFPINMLTLHQLWGVRTPNEGEEKLRTVREENAEKSNMEGWLLSQVGRELYEIFYKGYTTKQWGRDPSDLPASIAARVPIRLTFDDNYYNDRYQGIPIGGYTRMVEQMLRGIEVRLACCYFDDVPFFRSCARTVVFTGSLGKFFGYRFGRLEYRSLQFAQEIHEGDFQGVVGVNYTDLETPYTRVVEHKHFEPSVKSAMTVITREYPVHAGPNVEPFYPANDAANNALYAKYRDMADAEDCVLFGGRLASYKYYYMHQVVAQALAMSKRETERWASNR